MKISSQVRSCVELFPLLQHNLRILTNGIAAGRENNFDKIESGLWDSFNQRYDYSSILHYSGKALGEGKETIRPFNKTVRIGQRRYLSESDAIQLNKMHNCSTIINTEKCKLFMQGEMS